MGFFSTKKDVMLEDFCRDFYDKNILNGTMHGVDVNTTYYKGFQNFIGEVFPSFLDVDFDKLKEEFTILRFELFSLALLHSFGEETSVSQSVFTMHFLEEKNKQDIWKRMQRYNSAIASGVRKSICASENDNKKLDSDKIDVITSYLSKKINLNKDNFSDEEKKYTEAINRVGSRIKSEKGWKDYNILYFLSFTLLRNLGFTDDEILKVSTDKPFGHIMNVLNGFYNGAKESWEDVKIINDDNSDKYKQEEIAENQTGNEIEENEKIEPVINPKRTGNFWSYSKTMGRDEAIDVYKMWLLHSKYYHQKLDVLFHDVSIPNFFLPIPMELLQETSSIIKEFTDENGTVWTEESMNNNLEKYAHRYYPRTGNDEEIIKGLGNAINNKHSLDLILQKIKENKDDWYFEYKEL